MRVILIFTKYGLEYFHLNFKVIHHDISASNILKLFFNQVIMDSPAALQVQIMMMVWMMLLLIVKMIVMM